jgi:hypothetical protein
MAKSQSPISLVSTVRGGVTGAGLVALASTLTGAVKANPYTLSGGALGGAITDNVVSWVFNKPVQPTIGERIIGNLRVAGEVAMATTAVIGAIGTVTTVGVQLVQLARAIRAGKEIQPAPQPAPDQERASA